MADRMRVTSLMRTRITAAERTGQHYSVPEKWQGGGPANPAATPDLVRSGFAPGFNPPQQTRRTPTREWKQPPTGSATTPGSAARAVTASPHPRQLDGSGAAAARSRGGAGAARPGGAPRGAPPAPTAPAA